MDPSKFCASDHAISTARRDFIVVTSAMIGLSYAVAGCSVMRAPHVVMDLAPEQSSSSRLTTGAATTTVRTAVDPNYRMTAPVSIDGKGPYQFIVDTGANISVITTDLANELAMPPARIVQVHGIAGSFLVPTTYVSTLSIGSIKTTNLMMPTMNVDFVGARGIIGVDVLRDRIVQIDFAGHRISIGSVARPPHTDWNELLAVAGDGSRIPRRASIDGMVAVPARYRFGQLTVVDADVAGLPIVAFLDSGSQTTVGNLALQRGLAQRNLRLAGNGRHETILSVTGQTADAELGVLPNLRLGGLRIDNVPTAFSDLHAFEIWQLANWPAILVGMDVLKHFHIVELDFAEKQVRFYFSKQSL